MFRPIYGVVAALLCLAGCSPVLGPLQPAMVTYGDAMAPPAFYSFCEKDKRLCSTKGTDQPEPLTEARRNQLRSVNSAVNATVREEPDSISEGAADVWEAATNVGDCEDIAISKKKRLLALGWPASTLLLTVVRPQFSNAGHTVLTARTSEGDLILDNLNNEIRNWSRTPYRFYARQSVAKLGGWEFIRKPSEPGRAGPMLEATASQHRVARM